MLKVAVQEFVEAVTVNVELREACVRQLRRTRTGEEHIGIAYSVLTKDRRSTKEQSSCVVAEVGVQEVRGDDEQIVDAITVLIAQTLRQIGHVVVVGRPRNHGVVVV
jgi:hypothetical protein